MPEKQKLEFDILDPNGSEYDRWVTDVETTFIGKELISTIRAPDANTKAPPASKAPYGPFPKMGIYAS